MTLRRFFSVISAVALIGGLIMYSPTLFIGYLSDDWLYAYLSQHKTFFDAIQFLWSTDTLGSGAGNYRPLPSIFATLIWKPFFNSAWVIHVLAIMLHSTTSVLVGGLGYALFKRRDVAVISTALFLVYPLNVSVATWLSAANSSMALIPLLAALILYATTPELSKKVAMCISILLVLSFLSKEYALLFPIYTLALDVLLKRKIQWRWLIWFGAINILYLVTRFTVLGGLGGYVAGDENSLHTTINEAGAEKFLYLPIFYIVNFYNRLAAPEWLGMIARIVTIIALTTSTIFVAVYKRKSLRVLIVLFAFVYLGNLLGWNLIDPLSPVNGHSRIIYFSTVWACIGLAYLFTRLPKRIGYTVSVAVVVMLAMLMQYQMRPWIRAGEVTQQINEDISAVVSNEVTSIQIENLPDQYQGAFIYRNGIRQFIALHLGVKRRDVAVEAVMQPGIDNTWSIQSQ